LSAPDHKGGSEGRITEAAEHDSLIDEPSRNTSQDTFEDGPTVEIRALNNERPSLMPASVRARVASRPLVRPSISPVDPLEAIELLDAPSGIMPARPEDSVVPLEPSPLGLDPPKRKKMTLRIPDDEVARPTDPVESTRDEKRGFSQPPILAQRIITLGEPAPALAVDLEMEEVDSLDLATTTERKITSGLGFEPPVPHFQESEGESGDEPTNVIDEGELASRGRPLPAVARPEVAKVARSDIGKQGDDSWTPYQPTVADRLVADRVGLKTQPEAGLLEQARDAALAEQAKKQMDEPLADRTIEGTAFSFAEADALLNEVAKRKAMSSEPPKTNSPQAIDHSPIEKPLGKPEPLAAADALSSALESDVSVELTVDSDREGDVPDGPPSEVIAFEDEAIDSPQVTASPSGPGSPSGIGSPRGVGTGELAVTIEPAQARGPAPRHSSAEIAIDDILMESNAPPPVAPPSAAVASHRAPPSAAVASHRAPPVAPVAPPLRARAASLPEVLPEPTPAPPILEKRGSVPPPRARAASVPPIPSEAALPIAPPPAKPRTPSMPSIADDAVLAVKPISTAQSRPEAVPASSASPGSQVPSTLREDEKGAASKRKRGWWDELFDEDYFRAVKPREMRQVRRDAFFIEESLAVAKGGSMLDLGCGTGDLAVELAAKGYRVCGLDASQTMISRSFATAKARSVLATFVLGDMRDMNYEDSFDGVFCWDGTFGFFDDERNAQVLSAVHRALRKGGQFLIDVPNRDYVIRQSPTVNWFEGKNCICMDEMQMDWISSRLKVKRTMMLEEGRSRELEYSIRLYAVHELGRMLHDCGFRVAELSGRMETPGVYFGPESPRSIVLAEKR
jgi:SAM-dependent methyltransferase